MVPHNVGRWGDGVKRIPLRARDGSVRAYARVDDQDYERLSCYRWSMTNKGRAARYEWDAVAKKTHTILMHRQILGLLPGDPRQGDHKNRNPLDNVRSNLRIATNAQNEQNRSSKGNKGSSSQYRNVYWDNSRRKWYVHLMVDRKAYFFGRFDDEHEAGRVASQARAELMPFAMS